jgi:predicted nucleic acid-binding protein
MIIADANLLAYYVLAGDRTKSVERMRALDNDWIAPVLLRHELLNVFGNYIRKASMSRDRAIRLYRRAISIVRFDERTADPIAIFRLVEEKRLTAFDAQYLWLAYETKLKLVTADRALIAADSNVVVHIDDFSQ